MCLTEKSRYVCLPKWKVLSKIQTNICTWFAHRSCCQMFASDCQWYYKNTALKTISMMNWQGNFGNCDNTDRPSNLTQIRFELSVLRPVWPWNLIDDLENNWTTLLFYAKLCAAFKIHLRFQTGVTVRKRSIRVEIGAFLSRVTLKFDGSPWKQ